MTAPAYTHPPWATACVGLHAIWLRIQCSRLLLQAPLCKQSEAAFTTYSDQCSVCKRGYIGNCVLSLVCAFWQVGAIIGKGGEVISQLKTVIGVKIRISDRDDFVPGTRNRKVTISGAADAVQIAQVLKYTYLCCRLPLATLLQVPVLDAGVSWCGLLCTLPWHQPEF